MAGLNSERSIKELSRAEFPRELDSIEQRMLARCAAENPELAHYTLSEPRRGLFRSQHIANTLNYFFSEEQDPLFEAPALNAITFEEVCSIRTEGMSPEEKKKFYAAAGTANYP